MDPILGMLSTKEPISGERLCEQLGMTRAAVWKRMEKLRAEGYRIVSAGKLGYRLDPEENSLLPAASCMSWIPAGQGGAKSPTRRRWIPPTSAPRSWRGRARRPAAWPWCDQQTAGAGGFSAGGKPRGRGADAVAGAPALAAHGTGAALHAGRGAGRCRGHRGNLPRSGSRHQMAQRRDFERKKVRGYPERAGGGHGRA